MARNPSHKVYNRRFRETGRQLAAAARKDKTRRALELCVAEIDQFHTRAHPDCTGGCPACEAMDAARVLLGSRES
jgi:hypothetical protein